MKVWTYSLTEMDRHRWAFFYYCKRLGDKCTVDRRRGIVTIRVNE